MKRYQVIFEVPDDFNPDDLTLTASYGETPGQIRLADEGFELSQPELEEAMKDFIKELHSITVDNIGENSIVRVTFDEKTATQPYFAENIQAIMKMIENSYKVPCVCHMDNVDVLVEDANEAVAMFEKMIAKIKTRASVRDTSGIVLPN